WRSKRNRSPACFACNDAEPIRLTDRGEKLISRSAHLHACSANRRCRTSEPHLSLLGPFLFLSRCSHFGAIAADTHLTPAPAIVLGGVEKQPSALLPRTPLGP